MGPGIQPILADTSYAVTEDISGNLGGVITGSEEAVNDEAGGGQERQDEMKVETDSGD